MTGASTLQNFRHPLGLWIIAFCSALMCIGFGAINSQMVLYAPAILHFKQAKFYVLYATYNSLLFTLPLLGGFIAEKVGYLRAMVFGLTLCVIGLVLVSVPHIHSFYEGLGIYAVGTCLFVPSYLVLQGRLYAKDDPRRDSAYTLSYIIMNTGFLVSGIFSGYVAQIFGYATMFRAAAIISLCVYVLLFFGRKQLTPIDGRDASAQLKLHKAWIWLTLLIVSALMIIGTTLLLTHPDDNTTLLIALVGGTTLLILIAAFRQPEKMARYKLFALLILSYISIGFWALYTLEPSLLTVFIQNNVDRFIGTHQIPAAVSYSLDPFFVISFGLLLGWLWNYLARIKRNPSLPTKFALSLMTMAVGMWVLPVGIHFAGADHLTGLSWIVLCYVFLSFAELLISPIGQAMIGRLAPERMEGSLMGVWQLFTGFAGALSGYLDKLATVPEHTTVAATNPIYSAAFLKIGSVTFGLGIIAFLLIPVINKLIKEKAAN